MYEIFWSLRYEILIINLLVGALFYMLSVKYCSETECFLKVVERGYGWKILGCILFPATLPIGRVFGKDANECTIANCASQLPVCKFYETDLYWVYVVFAVMMGFFRLVWTVIGFVISNVVYFVKWQKAQYLKSERIKNV